MIRGLAVVALLGCSAPAKPTPSHATAAPDAPFCPPVADLGPWLHEVFPACSRWPLTHGTHLCAGAACPLPCAAVTEGKERVPGPAQRRTFAYDGRGRWVSWSLGDTLEATCTYEGEHLASCRLFEDQLVAERDAQRRLTAVVENGRRIEIRHDAEGRVIFVGGDALTYDAHGRLNAVGSIALERDDRGRVIRAAGPKLTELLTYDERGRVVHVEQKPSGPPVVEAATAPCDPDENGQIEIDCGNPGGPVAQPSSFYRYAYDGDRLVGSSSTIVPEQGSSTTYEYDCR